VSPNYTFHSYSIFLTTLPFSQNARRTRLCVHRMLGLAAGLLHRQRHDRIHQSNLTSSLQAFQLCQFRASTQQIRLSQGTPPPFLRSHLLNPTNNARFRSKIQTKTHMGSTVGLSVIPSSARIISTAWKTLNANQHPPDERASISLSRRNQNLR
jgi:hypothetical protein